MENTLDEQSIVSSESSFFYIKCLFLNFAIQFENISIGEKWCDRAEQYPARDKAALINLANSLAPVWAIPI